MTGGALRGKLRANPGRTAEGDVAPSMNQETVERLRSFPAENLMELERQVLQGIEREIETRKQDLIEEARKKRKKAKRKRKK